MSTTRRGKTAVQRQRIRRSAAAAIDLRKLSPLSHKLSVKTQTPPHVSKWRDAPKDHESLRD
jgi:hypothetical protein